MSELHVQVVAIDEVLEHPNADRLEIAKVADWHCVVGKGEFRAGSLAVYFPIDSVLSSELEGKLFPPGSKITLTRSRIRTIKIRGAVSQGMLVSPASLGLTMDECKEGRDLKERLGVTKYEPPVSQMPRGMLVGKSVRKGVNTNFHKYTDIENFKYYPVLFEGEDVYVSEKLHGTSARYGWLPTEANTWWKRLKRMFGMLPAHEWCLGSRNVQLQDRKYDGFYSQNVYGKIAEQERLQDKLLVGEVVYGEIVGAGIQKGYTYGCNDNEHRFYAYDVQKDGRWLDHAEFVTFCAERGIQTVPELYVGKFDYDLIDALRKGDSMIGGQKCREGVVVKPVVERTSPMIGRATLKWINDEYLLKDQSDFH